MRKRKFFSIKYTRRYSYAKFGAFFMCHPVYTYIYVHSALSSDFSSVQDISSAISDDKCSRRVCSTSC